MPVAHPSRVLCGRETCTFEFSEAAVLMKTLPFSAFLGADVVLIGCVLYDYSKTKNLQRAWLWGGLLFFLSFPLRMLIASTTTWQSFARWVIS